MVHALQIGAMALLKDKKKLDVLVTGNKGFVGTNLIKNLKDEVQLVTTHTSHSKRIDILNKNQLARIKTTDVIIHLASKTSIPNSITSPYETYLTNLLGTLNVLDFARERDIKKIINIGTYIYGNPIYFPIDEKHPVNPHSPYTKSKLIAEKICKYYSEDYKIDIVTLRPFYLYGPSPNQFSFIPSVIHQYKTTGKVILSNRNTRRDFLYIDDFIDLIRKILFNFPKGYNAYNVGFGKSVSLEKVIELMKNILSLELRIEYDRTMRPNDITDMVADIKKLEKEYGWKPKVNLETGMKLTLESILD